MKRLIYQVYVGPRSKLYDFCTASVADYADAHSCDYTLQTEPILRIKPDPKTSNRSEGASRLGYLPIFEKENALAFLGEYDQVAVIDADVWARPGAPCVFEEIGDADFAGVRECAMPVTHKYLSKIRDYSRRQYGSLGMPEISAPLGIAFYNMGVMVMNASLRASMHGQTPAEFLARAEFKRFVDGLGAWKWSTDQTLLNWWIWAECIDDRNINWKWNALYGALLPGMVEQAHFVHFFLRDHLPERGENVAELVKHL